MLQAARDAQSFLRIALVAAATVLLTGCMTGGDDDRVFVFRAYQFTNPRLVGGKLSRQLLDHEGKRAVWVRSIPLVTSVNVLDAEVVETDGARAVKLTLDHFGKGVWLQACKQLGGQEMAVTVDGFYLFSTTVPYRQARYDTMVVEGPWGRGQANGVATHARENYDISNPKPGM